MQMKFEWVSSVNHEFGVTLKKVVLSLQTCIKYTIINLHQRLDYTPAIMTVYMMGLLYLIACLVPRNTLVRFTASVDSNSLTPMSSKDPIAPIMPALFTSKKSGPNLSSANLIALMISTSFLHKRRWNIVKEYNSN